MIAYMHLTEAPELKNGTVAAGIFVPVPHNLAKHFPDKSDHDDSVPHFTLLYIGDITPEEQARAVKAIQEVARSWRPFRMDMRRYGEFTNHSGEHKIAHMIGDAKVVYRAPSGVSIGTLGDLHADLYRAVEEAGVPIAHKYGAQDVSFSERADSFKSHATLAYLQPEESYVGLKPMGSFPVTHLEVWGHETYKVPLGKTVADQPVEEAERSDRSDAKGASNAYSRDATIPPEGPPKEEPKEPEEPEQQAGEAPTDSSPEPPDELPAETPPGEPAALTAPANATLVAAGDAIKKMGRKVPDLDDATLDTVAKALKSMGKAEGIHRDPKPENILVESRPSCLDCVRKHLGQAAVLMDEARQGYPHHRWLAIGHIGEAASECLSAWPELAAELRRHRVRYMEDSTYEVPVMDLIAKVCERADGSPCAAEDVAPGNALVEAFKKPEDRETRQEFYKNLLKRLGLSDRVKRTEWGDKVRLYLSKDRHISIGRDAIGWFEVNLYNSPKQGDRWRGDGKTIWDAIDKMKKVKAQEKSGGKKYDDPWADWKSNWSSAGAGKSSWKPKPKTAEEQKADDLAKSLGVIDRTAAGGIVFKSFKGATIWDLEVLVAKAHPRYGSYWLFPKGGQDIGEDIKVAAAREVLEETGVKAKVADKQSFIEVKQFGDSGRYDLPLVLDALKKKHPGEKAWIEEHKELFRWKSFSFRNHANYFAMLYLSGKPFAKGKGEDEHKEVGHAEWMPLWEAERKSSRLSKIIHGLLPVVKHRHFVSTKIQPQEKSLKRRALKTAKFTKPKVAWRGQR